MLPFVYSFILPLVLGLVGSVSLAVAPLTPIRFAMFWFCFWLVRAVLNRSRNGIKYLFPKKLSEEEQPIPRSTEAIPSIDPPGTSPMNMSEDERPIPRETEWFQSPVPQVPSGSTKRPLPFPKDGDVPLTKEQKRANLKQARLNARSTEVARSEAARSTQAPVRSSVRSLPFPKNGDIPLTKEQKRANLKQARLNARNIGL